jgi:beta-phosphoglucomutase-like phosphatase (HAD superfamily)
VTPLPEATDRCPGADATALVKAYWEAARATWVTNGHPTVERAKLARAGLARYFRTVRTPQVGAGKPDRRIFAAAAKALGARLGAAVYVGDVLEWDLGGANPAGMASVWLNRSGLRRRPGEPPLLATIASLAQLPHLLAGMDARRWRRGRSLSLPPSSEARPADRPRAARMAAPQASPGAARETSASWRSPVL